MKFLSMLLIASSFTLASCAHHNHHDKSCCSDSKSCDMKDKKDSCCKDGKCDLKKEDKKKKA